MVDYSGGVLPPPNQPPKGARVGGESTWLPGLPKDSTQTPPKQTSWENRFHLFSKNNKKLYIMALKSFKRLTHQTFCFETSLQKCRVRSSSLLSWMGSRRGKKMGNQENIPGLWVAVTYWSGVRLYSIISIQCCRRTGSYVITRSARDRCSTCQKQLVLEYILLSEYLLCFSCS